MRGLLKSHTPGKYITILIIAGMGNAMDLSSMMSSGPGGLAGGSFFSGANTSALMGTDYSKHMTGEHGYGDTSFGATGGQVDTARFDTSAYQNQLKDMFNTDNVANELTGMGNPFDGSSYDLPTDHQSSNYYDTSKDSSLGSYASTDMSSYASTSGSSSSWDNIAHTGSSGRYEESNKADGYGTGSSTSSEKHASPFEVHNYSLNGASSSNNDDIKSPFDTSNSNEMGMGTKGNNPFTVTNTGSNSMFGSTGTGTGSSPFDASKSSNTGSGSYGRDSSSYSNMASGSQYTNTYSDNRNSGQFRDSSDSGQYRAGSGGSSSSYDTSGSMYSSSGYTGGSDTSQYKTPFESDNYNDLLGNPFKSDSYFDSNKQNFKLPYEKTDSAMQTGSGPSQQDSRGAGPAGDPFSQGGNSMGSSLGGPR